MPVHRKIFVQTPTARAMVHHDVAERIPAKRIIPPFQFAATKAEVAQDDVVCVYFGRFSANTDSIARGGLTGHGHVGIVDLQSIGQSNDSGDAKHNRARFLGSQRVSQTAGSAVSESRHFINFSTAAARGDGTGSLSAGK